MEIFLFIILFVWLAAVVIKADKLISNIHKRLDEIEKNLVLIIGINNKYL